MQQEIVATSRLQKKFDFLDARNAIPQSIPPLFATQRGLMRKEIDLHVRDTHGGSILNLIIMSYTHITWLSIGEEPRKPKDENSTLHSS